MNPKILIATTLRWPGPAWLAIALTNAGCVVEAVCPPQHPLAKTKSVRKLHSYRGITPLKSLRNAITRSKPDLIVTGDDLCVWHMHQIYRQARGGSNGAELCDLIERSLGAPESFDIVRARTPFIELARQLGIRAPKTTVVNNRDDLERWSSQQGFPVVLKADRTCGGTGVCIVHTADQAERALRALQAPPLLARAFKRAVVDKDRTLLWPSVLRHRHAVNAQEFVAGREATSTVLCWNGSILASLHFEVVKKRGSAGPSSVLRVLDHPEVTTAVEKIVRRLGLSGIVGFDFMLETSTGNAHLIEINPRATQTGHLVLGNGQDIPGALHACLSGQQIRPAQHTTKNQTIALFPQEWMRDPQSPFLRSAYHDVPWEEPQLVRECLAATNGRSWRFGNELSAHQLPSDLQTSMRKASHGR